MERIECRCCDEEIEIPDGSLQANLENWNCKKCNKAMKIKEEKTKKDWIKERNKLLSMKNV